MHHGRNRNVGQAAGERLFIFMGVIEGAGAVNGVIRSDDLPSVGIMIPTRIGVFDRDRKRQHACSGFFHSDIEDIGFTGGRRCREQKQDQMDKGFHKRTIFVGGSNGSIDSIIDAAGMSTP